MPEEPSKNSEEPANQKPQEPKTRRVSNKNPRKAAKQTSKRATTPKVDTGDNEPGGEATFPIISDDAGSNSKPEHDEGSRQEPKRNNRRRRGKGNASEPTQNSDQGREGGAPSKNDSTSSKDDLEEGTEKREPSNPNGQAENRQRPAKKPRIQHNPKKVAKKAWKIFLAEVSEEGVALIGDNDARELSRRCFRLAELFIEEQSRRG